MTTQVTKIVDIDIPPYQYDYSSRMNAHILVPDFSSLEPDEKRVLNRIAGAEYDGAKCSECGDSIGYNVVETERSAYEQWYWVSLLIHTDGKITAVCEDCASDTEIVKG